MKPGLNSRQLLIWSTLALTVLATIWTSLAEDEEQEFAGVAVNHAASAGNTSVSNTATGNTPASNNSPSARPRTQLAALHLPAAEDAAALDTRQLQRPRWEAGDDAHDPLHDPFQGSRRQAQVETEALPAAQQVMEIPALPFSYAGKLVDNDQYTVFLSAGEQNYSVKRGDVVLGWQVKSITPTTMIMRYQAMQMDVPLMIGEQN